MANLRDLRDRIKSVKSTKKITSAMKMVAASKLRRAQEQAEAAQPYAQAMAGMMSRVAANVSVSPASPKLLVGTGSDKRHLIVVVTADRGLCGGFNSNPVRRAIKMAAELRSENKEVSLICAGSKGYDILKRSEGSSIWEKFSGIMGKSGVDYAEVSKVTEFILEKFEDGEFDICSIIYNEFVSVLTQTPVVQQLIPFKAPETQDNAEPEEKSVGPISAYDFEPEEDIILGKLLPRNIGVQIYRGMLDSSAGEHAARMTAMENATQNAGEMIDSLSLQYNRARQAHITKELIEIISGAEAL